MKHGGARLCKKDGCQTYARVGGLCQHHYKQDLKEDKSKEVDQDILSLLLRTTESVDFEMKFLDDIEWMEDQNSLPMFGGEALEWSSESWICFRLNDQSV